MNASCWNFASYWSIHLVIQVCFIFHIHILKIFVIFVSHVYDYVWFQVDRGVILSEALLMHDKWLEERGVKNTNFAVVTWSNWDCRVMLESECRFKKIRKPPYFNR